MAETRLAAWGQERRLEFIDFRLYWEGRLNRSDLVDFFGISVPQASLDLAKYQEMAPKNAIYDRTEKTYLATDAFTPVVTSPDTNPYLNQLLAVKSEILADNATFFGWMPPVGAVKFPARPLSAPDLRMILSAIRTRRIIRMSYQSMNQPAPTERSIAPHAIAFDGARWHIRAYCYERRAYRDFVFGRILKIALGGASDVDPANDSIWRTEIEAVVEPHPKLSMQQRKAIELEYGMVKGCLVLKIREALLFYLLHHLSLLRESAVPAESNFLFLRNRHELAPFFKDHELPHV
jgi:hypothetical protein